MDENSLPLRVETFVRENIPSVCHLDTLVRLVRMSPARVTVSDLAVISAQKEEVLAAVLADLAREGLTTSEQGEHWYSPETPALGQQAEALVDAYDRFPVQLIRVVYEPRTTPSKNIAAQTFADAFRLRKE